MCTRGECVRYMGQWVRFETPWGVHRGVVTDINHRAVLVRVPRRYAPSGLVSNATNKDTSDEQRLDLALTQYGYGGYGGYPGYGGYGRWGYPGYGGWYGGWWWWWLAFAWVFWLAFLW